jgi:CO/xanthine dehydrogenase Mo-binding subunit
MTGMLYGAVLRSPHAHAIKSIDVSAASRLGARSSPRRICLGRGIASSNWAKVANMRHRSANIWHRQVLYKGHAIAGVAADNVHIAAEAIKRIKVEYEVLPSVLDVRQAMRDDAPVLNDDVRTTALGVLPAGKTSKPTNIAKHFLFEKGDIAKGFTQAAVVVEHEFDTATVHQGYIEPHNATAVEPRRQVPSG